MAKKNDYFGLSWVVSLILAIIPGVSNVCGIITRWQDGAVAAAVIRGICFLVAFVSFIPIPFAGLFGLIGGVIWLIDLVCMILAHHIWRLL